MAIKKKPAPEEEDPPTPSAAAPPPPPPIDVSEKNFIAELVPDPASPPALAFLSGYPGDSPLPDHVRLYTSPDLQAYVDVPLSAVIAKASAPHPLCSPGAEALWIKQDAQVTSNQQPVSPQAMNTIYPPTQHPTLGFTCTLINCPPQQAALPRTLETICTQIGCPTAANGDAAAAPQAAGTQNTFVGPTGWYTCGQPQPLLSAPPNCPLPPPHISLPGCVYTATTTVQPTITVAGAAPQAAGAPNTIVGPTGWYTCGQPLLSAPPNCPLPPPHISLPGCVYTATTTVQPTTAAAAPQAAGAANTLVGPTGWYTCGQPLLSAPPHCPLPPHHISLPGCVHTTTVQPTTTPDPVGAAAAPQAAGAANTLVGPTGWFTCGQPLLSAPPNCPLPPPHISLPGCVYTATTTVQPTITVAAAPQAAAPTTLVGPTGWYTCGQPLLSAPPHCPLPPPYVSLPGCVYTATTTVQPTTTPDPVGAAAAPQAAGAANTLVGPTGWYTCGQPLLSAPPHCPLPPPYVSLPGCVYTATTTVQPITADQSGAAAAPQAAGANPVGPTGWYTCGQPLLSAPPHCPLPPPHISLPGCVQTGTTIIWPTLTTVQPADQGGAAAAPQAAGAPNTIAGPTGWFTCGQPLLSAPPHCPLPPLHTVSPAACPILSRPPHCPTVSPLCPPHITQPLTACTIATATPVCFPVSLNRCPSLACTVNPTFTGPAF